MRWGRAVVVATGWSLLAGCTSATTPPPAPSTSPTSPTSPASSASAPAPAPAQSTATATSSAATAPPARADPRWRFFVADRSRRTSPWFAGAHRVMIGYGCTRAPYYEHDPRCAGRQGFHHGIDVAMPCGTPLYAARSGTVVDPASTGAPGAAYGPSAFRIRTGDVDVLVGHARKVYVDPGDVVRRGQLLARANDAAAPDGCHLHFEVRRAGGGLDDAVDPAPLLHLR
jgi:murein DD-endopeptidase MepM/ murein hydrolase activator NlpD